MRIYFDFTGSSSFYEGHNQFDEESLKELEEYSFWIDDFPCRINKKDEFSLGIIPDEKIRKILEEKCSILKASNQYCNISFSRDEKGIYQQVFLDIVDLCKRVRRSGRTRR